MSYLVGFDGGGTKTECLIADENGTSLGRGLAGPSSMVHRSEAGARREVRTAFKAAVAAGSLPLSARSQVRAVCGGFAAAARVPVVAALERILRELFPEALRRIVPDVWIAYEGATRGAPGVVVIAGTGSIVFGRNSAGREVRVGGWGPDISDEGSGHAIGREAVAAVLRAHDGRQSPTTLRHRLLTRWAVSDEDGLIERLRETTTGGGPSRRPPFAGLLPEVVEAAMEADAAAGEILHRAGSELAQLAVHAIHRLEIDHPLVALAGGVFHHAPQVEESFRRSLLGSVAGARIVHAQAPPVEGAVRMAHQLLHQSRNIKRAD
ncbi:MAG: N-acetylglucosamine kinase [Terriglobales bacterium]